MLISQITEATTDNYWYGVMTQSTCIITHHICLLIYVTIKQHTRKTANPLFTLAMISCLKQ